MIWDGLFNSSLPHVEIHLHPLSGVNEVVAGLVLKFFEDTRPDVMCVQPAAYNYFFQIYVKIAFESLFCHIFTDQFEILQKTHSQQFYFLQIVQFIAAIKNRIWVMLQTFHKSSKDSYEIILWTENIPLFSTQICRQGKIWSSTNSNARL